MNELRIWKTHLPIFRYAFITWVYCTLFLVTQTPDRGLSFLAFHARPYITQL